MPAPILTVTLNAAVDKTYTVPGFALNRVHRPEAMHVTAGGKGINVARVYQTLGGRATATGFQGGSNGDYLRKALAAEGIDGRFVEVAGESRLCLAVLDPMGLTLTEVNENGPTVGLSDCEALLSVLGELLPGCGAVVLSGSLPPGTPQTLYRDMIRMAQEQFGVPAVLDASGEALINGLEGKPYLVKPNQYELAALGIPSDDLCHAALVLRERYCVSLAMVTAGGRGGVLSGHEGTWTAMPPRVRVMSAVGSGDSLTAGFLWSLLRGDCLPRALQLGVAAGTANVMSASAGVLDSQSVFHLASRTTVEKVS